MDDLPARKYIRLQNYDYSSNGAYFVTVCVNNTNISLWSDADIIHLHDTPSLSKYGTIIDEAIRNIPEYYPHVVIDKYCIMPDHIHLIVFIHSGNNERMISANSESSLPTLSTIVGQMKRYVSKQIGFSIWQKSFYEHIIRNEKGYQDVWQYIDGNPVKWKSDINYKQEF